MNHLDGCVDVFGHAGDHDQALVRVGRLLLVRLHDSNLGEGNVAKMEGESVCTFVLCGVKERAEWEVKKRT